MLRYRLILVFTLSLLTAAECAQAQRRGLTREEAIELLRQRSSSRSRTSQPVSTVAAVQRGATTSSKSKATQPPTGPQVNVDILFLEITSAADAKKPLPKLTGNAETIKKALQQLKKNGQLRTENRISISAIDGQKAMSQTGGTTSIVRSITIPGRGAAGRGGGFAGRTSRSYSTREVGTMVTLTPTVESNNSVVLQTSFSKSWLQGGSDAGTEAGETTAPASIANSQISNTVRVTPGEYAVLSSTTKTSKNGIDRIIVLISATVKVAPEEKRETRIFKLASADAKQVADLLKQLLGKETKVTIVPDARTNTVLAKGPTKRLAEIEAIIEKLDAPK